MVRRLPPLTALRAFEAAARLESFSKAADELAVTPTAISHQVRGLEDFLGTELFVRLPRGLRLTVQGAAYLPELTRGFDQLARAGERLTDHACAGLLHVSLLGSFNHCWLIPRLPKFRSRWPDIHLRISVTGRHVDFLREGVDLSIRYGLGDYPGMRSNLFLSEEVFPVASPALLSGSKPLRTWADLAHHTLIDDHVAQPNERWITWDPWLRSEGVYDLVTATCGRLDFSTSAATVEAAVRGQGVTMGRTALVAEHLRDGRLVALFDSRRPADFAYYAVAPETTADQPMIKAFMEWLIEEGAKDQVQR